MTGLEAIWRLTIKHEVTEGLIAVLCRDNPEYLDIPAGDPRFFALLATDHGKGPGRLLSTYVDMFGRKRMSRARVYPWKGISRPNLCWFLEVVPPEHPSAPPAVPDSPLSKKEARKYKRILAKTGGSLSHPSHARTTSAP